MPIKKFAIPADSLTNNYLPADYADIFKYTVNCGCEINPDDVMVNFWTNSPRWVGSLFRLRNFLVKFVGLKGNRNNNMQALEDCIRKGENSKFVSVAVKNKQETVLLLTDKHLNAYLSAYVYETGDEKIVAAITLVHFRNTLGKAYFFFIRPFHNLIVKSILKRAVEKAITDHK